jgi:hypothetical protein
MVVDNAASSDAVEDLAIIPRLNDQEWPHISDALAHAAQTPSSNLVPPSNGDAIDITLLTHDALRIADTLRRNGKPEDAAKIVDTVKADTAIPAVMATAAWPVIQNQLARYALFGQSAEVRALHASEIMLSGPATEHSIPLYDPDPQAHRIVHHMNGGATSIRMTDDRTLVLVFSLAGPASDAVIRQSLDKLTADHVIPELKVIAVTSFAANIGRDTPDGAVFASLRSFRTALPTSLPMYIVPNSELEPFAIDSTPAAILLDGKGRILWLNTLSGTPGSVRQMIRDVENAPPELPQ